METEWLAEAQRRFGDREDIFAYVDSPYSLWFNLRDVFKRAYDSPRDEADIRSIYQYADWSCREPRGKTAEDDLLTCVAVCFYEHIPEIEAAVEDLPRWFDLREIMAMREIFSYQVGEAGFEQILEAYPRKQRAKFERKKSRNGERKPRKRR